jgi:NAD-dependent dihydropyrimidine dehydrogenase PreA subunit
VGEWIPVPKEFVEIDQEKCTGCGHCITICGGEVFALKDEKAAVSRIDQCLECWNCETICAPGAITVHVPAGGTGLIHTCG